MVPISFKAFFQGFGISPTAAAIVLVVLLVWTLYWKGRAMWVSARSSENIWFIVFLLVNTIGILEIIYLYFINKRDKTNIR